MEKEQVETSMTNPERPTMTSDGGPAFPTGQDIYGGLTIRDWFAGQALIGIISNATLLGGMGQRDISTARIAYEIADAMLAQRSKP